MRARLKGFSLLHLFGRNDLRAESCCEVRVDGEHEKGSLTSAAVDDALAVDSPGHFDFRAYPHVYLVSSVRVIPLDLNGWSLSCTASFWPAPRLL